MTATVQLAAIVATTVATSAVAIASRAWATSPRRATRRAFRRIARAERPRTVAASWHAPVPVHGDVRVRPNDGVAVVVGAMIVAAVALGVAGYATGDHGLVLASALVGGTLASAFGGHADRTHATVTAAGSLIVANGAHRRVRVAPAIAVSAVALPEPARRSRWSVRRACAVVVLHGGDLVRVRAISYDPVSGAGNADASALVERLAGALADAGAVLGDARRRAAA